MRNQKGFIQIPLLIAIILGVLVLSGAGYVGIKKYQDHNVEEPKNTETQTTQDTQDFQQTEIDILKKEIEAIKNSKSPTPKTIIKEVPQKTEPDLSSVINQWKKYIVQIECNFTYQDGSLAGTSFGSGLLGDGPQDSAVVNTNKHVLSLDDKNTPTSCIVRAPYAAESFSLSADLQNHVFKEIAFSNIYDFGQIYVKPSYSLKKDLAFLKYCSKDQIQLGDKVIILGYPSIGGAEGITVTDGIISSFDGSYYVTSAKVEEGNSGGAAILVEDSCYIGIPSYAVIGNIESLARILDWNVLFR